MTRPTTSSKPSEPAEREVRPYKPTWLDKKFRKSFAALQTKQQSSCEKQLTTLIASLKRCRHPQLDPNLGRWRPTTYHTGKSDKSWQLVEYDVALVGLVGLMERPSPWLRSRKWSFHISVFVHGCLPSCGSR